MYWQYTVRNKVNNCKVTVEKGGFLPAGMNPHNHMEIDTAYIQQNV